MAPIRLTRVGVSGGESIEMKDDAFFRNSIVISRSRVAESPVELILGFVLLREAH